MPARPRSKPAAGAERRAPRARRAPTAPSPLLASTPFEREEAKGFLLPYRFGMREVETKIGILRDEFEMMHDHNPIEHVSSRLKSVEALVEKLERKGIRGGLEDIRTHITDIAGVRVTCAFVSDAYRMFELLTAQDDIEVRAVKDYIASPKPNGYRSLHAIVAVPVFLSSGTMQVPVEVQFRTIAMDFWASLDHKIQYKFAGHVPEDLRSELLSSAETAAALDRDMERIHRQIRRDGLPGGDCAR